MPNDVDFDGIGNALAALFQTGLSGFGVTALYEPDALDYRADNTPLITILLADGTSNPKPGQSYYDIFTMDVEITAIDLSNWATAAKTRTAIFRAARGLIRSNPRFHVDVNECQLGDYEFERAVDSDQEAWYAAVCRFEVKFGVYYDL